jgi:hypothetical protein
VAGVAGKKVVIETVPRIERTLKPATSATNIKMSDFTDFKDKITFD